MGLRFSAETTNSLPPQEDVMKGKMKPLPFLQNRSMTNNDTKTDEAALGKRVDAQAKARKARIGSSYENAKKAKQA